MGITIDVVSNTLLGSNSEYDNGHLLEQAKLDPGSLRTYSLTDMVLKVRTRSAGTTIDTLRIFGHGYAGSQWVAGGFEGSKMDDAPQQGMAIYVDGGFLHDRELLGKLTSLFTPDDDLAYPIGLVELHGCSVGKGAPGRTLVRLLAELWGVRVRAGLDLQEPDEGDNFEGSFVEATPLGTVWQYAPGGSVFILVPPFQSPPERSKVHIVGGTITKDDWLSSLAGKYYNDVLLWPIIFDKNRDAIFTNPNVMRPRQHIEIPPLPSLTAQKREEIRARGRNWRQYN